MRLKNALFLSILLVVVAAGCVGGTSKGKVSFDQNAGVKIDQFSFDVGELYEKEDVVLTLKVQNVGAKSMSADSKLWIYGPKIGAVPATPPAEGNPKWVTSDPALDTATGTIIKTLSTSTFVPPDVERGIPGSIDITQATLTAPGVNENMKRDDTFYVRVCYPYQTDAITRLIATTKNQLRTEAIQKTDAVTRASAGPIQLKMLSGENLVAGRPMQLVFEITDVGGGFATPQGTAAVTTCTGLTSADVPTGNLNRVKVSVNVDGTSVTGCVDKVVTLSNGKGTLFCSAPATTTSSPKAEYTVTATAAYNYFLTERANVAVKDSNL